MKNKFLLEQFKLSLTMINIVCPINIISFIVAGCILWGKSEYSIASMILFFMAIVFLLMFFLIRKYMKKKIKELENESENELD